MAKVSKWCRKLFGYPCYSKNGHELLENHGTSQVIKLPNGEYIKIRGLKYHCFGRFIWMIFRIFWGWIVLHRCPLWLFQFVGSTCTLAASPAIIVSLKQRNFVHYGQLETVCITGQQRLFTWGPFRFVWNSESAKFKRIHYIDEVGLRLSEVHGLINGLDKNEVDKKTETYGKNSTNFPTENWFLHFVQILSRPLRLLQFASIVIWTLQEYLVYSVFFITVSLSEIAYRIITKEKYNQQIEKDCLKSLSKSWITVVSNGEKYEVPVSSLVPGNVVEISSKDVLMPCDAVVLNGSCLVQEIWSSVQKHKYQLPKSRTEIFNIERHSNHVIFRGSTILLTQDKVLALVVRTGWATKYGTLLLGKLRETQMASTLNRHLNYLFIFLFVVGTAGAIYVGCIRMVRHPLADLHKTIVDSLDVFSTSLPPLYTIGLALVNLYPLVQLYRSGFQLRHLKNSLSFMNRMGAIDTVCFIKSAIMKDFESSALAVHSVQYKHDWTQDYYLKLCLGCCHSLVKINDELIGNANDLQIFNSSSWSMTSFLSNLESNNKAHFCITCQVQGEDTYQITRLMNDFSVTSLPLTLVRADKISSKGESWFFIKGSLTSIMKYVDGFAANQFVSEYVKKINIYKNELVFFAGRPLTEFEKVILEENDINSLSLTKKFQLLGMTVVSVKSSSQTRNAISQLRAANIRTLFLSDQEVHRALQQARSSGIILPCEPIAMVEIHSRNNQSPPSISINDICDIDPEESCSSSSSAGIQKYAHVIVTGATLNVMYEDFPEISSEIIQRVTIVAEADSLQMRHFLQELERTFVICQDRDDPLTLDTDLCLTLGQDGKTSALCRGITTDQWSVLGLIEVIRQCRTALIGALGIIKLLLCYALAELTSTLILYENNNYLPTIQYFYIDFVLIALPVSVFGYTKSNEGPLSEKKPAKSFIHIRHISSVCVQIIFMIIGQSLALIMAQHQPWFHSSPQDSALDSVRTDENYAIFSVSLFQYITFSLIFSHGKPHRKPLWTNIPFLLIIVLITTLSSVLVLHPPGTFQKFFMMKAAPEFDFRLAIFCLNCIYMLVSLIVQHFLDSMSFSTFTKVSVPSSDTELHVLYNPSSVTNQYNPVADQSEEYPFRELLVPVKLDN